MLDNSRRNVIQNIIQSAKHFNIVCGNKAILGSFKAYTNLVHSGRMKPDA